MIAFLTTVVKFNRYNFTRESMQTTFAKNKKCGKITSNNTLTKRYHLPKRSKLHAIRQLLQKTGQKKNQFDSFCPGGAKSCSEKIFQLIYYA